MILGVYFSPSRAVRSSNTQVEKEKKKKKDNSLWFAKYINFSLFLPEGWEADRPLYNLKNLLRAKAFFKGENLASL